MLLGSDPFSLGRDRGKNFIRKRRIMTDIQALFDEPQSGAAGGLTSRGALGAHCLKRSGALLEAGENVKKGN